VRYPQLKATAPRDSQTSSTEDHDVDDDETGEVVRETDLSHEIPTGRAHWSYRLEKTWIKISKTGLEFKAESRPGTALNTATVTVYLALAIAGITGIAYVIGIPAVAALVTGLGATIGLYLLVYFTSASGGSKD
jgi:hypothetical protein